MPLASGARLGPYELIASIGAGGMGEVYRARDTKLGRDVAIKVLHPEMATDSNRLGRFEQEARAASALNHPNIVTIYEIGEHDGTPYIAMEYVKGRTLREVLADGALPVDKLIRYASQMAEGLAKAHQAGIVHRDLKPENIIISEDSYVKILDFGLAKLSSWGDVGSELATALKAGTTPGTILGTVGYMSPEQAKGESADFRSDQFSLGVILYEMACGAAAFHKEAAAQTLAAIIESEPGPLSERNADAPPELEGIVARLLSKNVDGRYGSTGDLSKDLRALSDGLVVSNVSSRSITASTTKRPLTWAWLAAVSLVLALGALWWLRPSVLPPEQPAATDTDPAHQVIAVLPFENIAADSSQDYFSAGMTEEISNQLSKLASLQVLSRAAVEPYRDTQDISGMARELGVGSLVTGSVRLAPNRVRVNVQLVDADNKRTLWSEQYDRRLEDIFEVQSDVALRVAAALQTTLSPGEQQRIEKRPTQSVPAYDLYLRAANQSRLTREGREEELSLLRQAVELDPDFALAYARMARVFMFRSFQEGPVNLKQGLEMAHRAIELSPDHSAGHSALGDLYLFSGKLKDAKVSYLRATELNPSDTVAVSDHSIADLVLGNYDESLYWARRFLVLNPNSPSSHAHIAMPLTSLVVDETTERWLFEAEANLRYYPRIQIELANLDMLRGRDADAMDRMNDAAARQPANTELRLARSTIAFLTSSANAEALIQSQFQDNPDARAVFGMKLPGSVRTFYASMLWQRGERTQANPLLDEALNVAQEELKQGNELPNVPLEIASIYALRDERQTALRWLERGYEAGWRGYRMLGRYPPFEGLREEPRFRAVLERMEEDVSAMRRRARERGLLDFDPTASAGAQGH